MKDGSDDPSHHERTAVRGGRELKAHLHLFNVPQVCVLGVLELGARLLQLGLHRQTLVVEHGELGLQTLVLRRLHDHRLGQVQQLQE